MTYVLSRHPKQHLAQSWVAQSICCMRHAPWQGGRQLHTRRIFELVLQIVSNRYAETRIEWIDLHHVRPLVARAKVLGGLDTQSIPNDVMANI